MVKKEGPNPECEQKGGSQKRARARARANTNF